MPASSNIRLLLEGLIAIFIKNDQSECTVGILKSPPPDHKLEIDITETIGGMTTKIPISIKDPLDLKVTGTSQTNITLRDVQPSPLDRRDRTKYRGSFSWVVDIENPAEFYKTPIGALKAEFKPLLTFNVGELFTEQVSRNRLQFQPGRYANYQELGFVAVTIGVDIDLDKQGSEAVFTSGGAEVFKSKPNASYLVKITHESTKPHPKIITDANHYYKAMGLGLPENEKILFMSVDETMPLTARLEEARLRRETKLESALEEVLKLLAASDPPAGPEAACFTVFLSRSQPS